MPKIWCTSYKHEQKKISAQKVKHIKVGWPPRTLLPTLSVPLLQDLPRFLCIQLALLPSGFLSKSFP